MNKWIAQIMDHIGLYLLHRQKSPNTQFQDAPSLLPSEENGKIEGIYPTPDLPELIFEKEKQVRGYEIGRYSDQSEARNGKEQYKGPGGLYYMRSDHIGSELSPELPELPSLSPIHVIVVHGWRSDSLDRVKNIFERGFIEQGYNMFFVTLPYHIERSLSTSYSGEHMISANVERSVAAVKQAVEEIRGLIHWLKKYRGGRVVLVGVSFGGLIANLASVVEEHIDQLVSIMYSNNLSYEIWHTCVGKHIKKDFEQHGFTYEQLKKHWANLEPGRWKPKLPKENILLISALYDLYIEKEDADQLWEDWDRPMRLLYPCGHAGLVTHKKRIAGDVIDFIEQRGYR